jgi:ribose 5-phosphate isomerase B
MKISVASDHGGYRLKEFIVSLLKKKGYEIIDHGTNSDQSVNYPDYANVVTDEIASGRSDRGILICGTGIGMSMAANRNSMIRAAVCGNEYTARMSREHNNANILCLGERVIGPGLAADIVKVWLETEFAGGRHLQRIRMF